MAATWPISLPASPLLEGFQEQLPETFVRTTMEMGPAKTRRRYTAAPSSFAMAFNFDDDQLDAFRTFFLDTLEGGSLSFDFNHPITGETLIFRFQEPPSIRKIAPGSYMVATKVEQIP